MKRFIESIESEGAEEFLELLLKLMKLVFAVDRGYRKNIENFNGSYCFLSRDGEISVSAIFADGDMKVREKVIPHPNITIIFKDGKTLMGFLLAPKPDILGSMLRQEVTLDGNLNYLYKFAFMAKRLRSMAMGQA
jgi:hypothetical protein